MMNKTAANPSAQPGSTSDRITVLIADDHPIFRRGLREIFLEDHRFMVLAEVADGAEALRVIQKERPKIAVLDIRMPKLTGLEVVRAVQKERLPTRVVLLTMHPDEELFDQAVTLGVMGYVLKENAIADILTAAESVAQGRFYISQSLSGLLVGRRNAAHKLEQNGLNTLSPTERRILSLIATDKTSKEIASELSISVRTVDSHRQNISQKLNLQGSHSLLKFAYDNKTALMTLGRE